MLGKLDFEQDSSTDEEGVRSDQRQSSYTAYDALRHPANLGYGRPQTMAVMSSSGVNGIGAKDIGQGENVVPPPRISMEEQMEHLVSPDKKQTWTPQSRRMSVSSDLDEPVRPLGRAPFLDRIAD